MREQDVEKTYVVFRKDEGEIVAVMPYPATTRLGSLTVYAHIGQHSEGDIGWYRERTHAAKPQEYAELKREMEGLGYRSFFTDHGASVEKCRTSLGGTHMSDQAELPLSNVDLPAGSAVAWVNGRNAWLSVGGSLLVSCPGCGQALGHGWKCCYAFHTLTLLGADRRPRFSYELPVGYWMCRIDAHSFAPANALVNEMYADDRGNGVS